MLPNDQEARSPEPRVRIAVLVQDGLNQFLQDLLAGLGVWYEVRLFPIRRERDIQAALQWGDVIWLEWGNEVAVRASRMPEARQKPVVCRLHRYEAFAPFPEQIAWAAIDRLVLVTPHLQTLLEARLPTLSTQVAMMVIPNGVTCEAYPFERREPGFNLASVGYLHARKNPGLLLQILAELVRLDPRYRLFVAGTFQDPLIELYWHHAVEVMGLADHVRLDGWQDDVAGWLHDKHVLLSTSIHESFGYAIAEAMACGIKPVIHDFPFVKEIWPPELLFRTVREAVDLVTAVDYDSDAYRAYVERNFAFDAQLAQVRALIDELASRTPVPTRPAASALDQRPAFMQEPGRLRVAIEQLQRRPDF